MSPKNRNRHENSPGDRLWQLGQTVNCYIEKELLDREE